jgi:NinB protein
MKELLIHIRDKRIVNMHEMRDVFNTLKDGKYLITIKDVRKRSVQQNRFYWGVVVPMVRKGLYEAGFDVIRTNDDAHSVIKQVVFKKDVINNQTGEMITVGGSTKEMSIPEFNEAIEAVCRWAAEYIGIVIPSPNEQMAEFKEWQEYATNEIEE